MERNANAAAEVDTIGVVATISVEFARVTVIVGITRTQPRPGI